MGKERNIKRGRRIKDSVLLSEAIALQHDVQGQLLDRFRLLERKGFTLRKMADRIQSTPDDVRAMWSRLTIEDMATLALALGGELNVKATPIVEKRAIGFVQSRNEERND